MRRYKSAKEVPMPSLLPTVDVGLKIPSSHGTTKQEIDLIDTYEPAFRQLKIAFVSDFFVPNLGGVEMHMYNVA